VKEIWHWNKPYRILIVGLSIVKLGLLAVSLLTPVLYKFFIDDVLIEKKLNWMSWIIIGYIALFAIESALLAWQTFLNNKQSNLLTFGIRRRLWKTLQMMPQSKYDLLSPGEIKNRLDGDVDKFSSFIQQQVLQYAYLCISLPVIGFIMIGINWKLALFGFIMVPFAFFLTKRLKNGVEKTSQYYREHFGKYEDWFQHTIQRWKEIKSLQIENRQRLTFTENWHELSIQEFKKALFWFGNRSFVAFKDFFVTRMNLYFLGGLLIFNGEITVGSLLVFMSYYQNFFNCVDQINLLEFTLSQDEPSLNRVIEMLKYPTNENRNMPFQFKKGIEFVNVKYQYSGSDRNVLNDVSFLIRPGEKIGIVGKSGSGKSTLLKAMIQMCPITEGVVLIDNTDVTSYNTNIINEKIGVVLQNSYLFNLSIYENMLLANSKASIKDIEDACQLSKISDHIKSLPEKYETNIGELGIKLSGGQKQRLAIARILVRKPAIIILDEATSQLDYETECTVLENLRKLGNDTTLIIVAHRQSALKNMDRIIVIDEGKIVGDGNHLSLIGSCGVYRELFQYEAI